jgi:hypothetical protein
MDMSRASNANKLRRLRERIAHLPEEDATADEIAAIDQARDAFREGALEKVRNDLRHPSRASRRKKPQSKPGRRAE